MSDCTPPDSFPVPIMDGGGLYGGGSNTPPQFHVDAGLQAAATVPAQGAVILSIGQSITRDTFTAWKNAAVTDATMIQGASGGSVAYKWVNKNSIAWDRVRWWLTEAGLTHDDVDVVWMSVTGSQTQATTADTLDLILGNIRDLLPNVKQVFITNRPYGGYREKGTAEPGAWSEGLVVREFVQRHLGETTPWIGWTGDIWANGTTPRSDGLVWNRADYSSDGLHYSAGGKLKVGSLARQQFEASPFIDWYR